MLAWLWRATRGYRLRPWASPYLRWRIETWSGIPAGRLQAADFWRFVWVHRRDMLRFLRWAARNRKQRT